MIPSNPGTLPRTRELLERGIDERLQLGAQLYVSLGASRDDSPQRIEMVLGERAAGQPMTTDTLMIWLSSTKPVTAVAFGLLWQRGEVDLDDPVARYVPEFGAQGKEHITLRHILTHTGGIRMLNIGWPEASWREILDTICSRKPEPRWPIGDKAGYHLASSWFVLGEVISRIDGRSYSDFVRQEVLEPIGMLDSWIGMPEEQFQAYGDRIGHMYSTEKTVIERGWHRRAHTVGCSPGGNGYGPIRELGRFYEMLLRRGVTADGQRFLTPQTVEAMTTPHRIGLYDHTFRQKLDWGLGFIINSAHYGEALIPYGYGRHASRHSFGHSGFQSSTGFADPKHDLVVALVVNGNPGEPRHTQRFTDLAEAIYQDLELAAGDGPS